jgi:hypothetical protein
MEEKVMPPHMAVLLGDRVVDHRIIWQWELVLRGKEMPEEQVVMGVIMPGVDPVGVLELQVVTL